MKKYFVFLVGSFIFGGMATAGSGHNHSISSELKKAAVKDFAKADFVLNSVAENDIIFIDVNRPNSAMLRIDYGNAARPVILKPVMPVANGPPK